MSVKVMTEVWDHAPETLKSDEMLLLIKLADWADEDDRYAFPKVETVARKIRCSVWKTQRLLRSLVEKECLAIYDLPGHASLYVVQDLAQPHAWRPKLRWNGSNFSLRAYRPSRAKPRGVLHASPPPVTSSVPDEDLPDFRPTPALIRRNARPVRKSQTTFFPALTPKPAAN
jgi:hypothetical protein